jgi:hypothetical protein
MSRLRIVGALLVLVTAGAATQFVLSAGRDVLPYGAAERWSYYSEEDPYVQPYWAGVSVEQDLVEGIRLALSGGYAGRRTFHDETRLADSTEYEINEQVTINGFRVAGSAIGHLPLLGTLFARGGVGIGYCRYWRNYEYDSWTQLSDRKTESVIDGPMQTFLLGLGLDLGRRMSLLAQVELVGVSWLTESYTEMDGEGRVTSRGKRSYFRLDGPADPHGTGVTLGLAAGI